MKILVTGGAGFIGSHLVNRLLKEGRQIICVDDFNDYYPPRFKWENIVRHLSNPGYSLIEASVTNKAGLEKTFRDEKIDTVIHLAARAGIRASLANPLLYQKVNVIGTTNLLQLATTYKVKQFIFVSSSSIYGKNQPPFKETQPIKTPFSPYAASKRGAELICYVYHHLYKLNVTILRLFSVYGPRGRPDMAPYLFTQAILTNKPIYQFGDGSSSRDWTYIDDIINGIILATKKVFPFEIINLGNNDPVKLTKMIKEIETACNKKAKIKVKPVPPGEMAKTWADIKKAKKLLNWQPKTEFKQGMQNFVNWFKTKRLNKLSKR